MRQPPVSVLVSGSATQRPTRWLSITVLTLVALALACGIYFGVGAGRLRTDTAVIFIILILLSLAGAALDRFERRRRISRYDADVARVFDGLPLGLALIRSAGSTRGLVGYANAHFAEMTGHGQAGLLGVDLVSLAHPDDRTEVRARLEQVLDGRSVRAGKDVRLIRADGSLLWATLSYGLLHTPYGEPIAVAQITDNTLRKEAEDRLVRRAYHDPLTDLPNRSLMGEHLARILTRARRNETRVGVLFIDLDDFKEINDSFGHETGDRLLIEVAHRLRAGLRASDLAARIGGDEFVVVCEDVPTKDDLELVAERIRQAITFRGILGNYPVAVRASVGAVLATPAEDAEQILARADSVMYAEKVRRKAHLPPAWSEHRPVHEAPGGPAGDRAPGRSAEAAAHLGATTLALSDGIGIGEPGRTRLPSLTGPPGIAVESAEIVGHLDGGPSAGPIIDLTPAEGLTLPETSTAADHEPTLGAQPVAARSRSGRRAARARTSRGRRHGSAT